MYDNTTHKVACQASSKRLKKKSSEAGHTMATYCKARRKDVREFEARVAKKKKKKK